MTSLDQAFIRAYEPGWGCNVPVFQEVADGRAEMPAGTAAAQPSLTRPDDPPVPEKAGQPDSAADSPAACDATEPTAAGFPQPAYQVDAFRWPTNCTKLGLKADGQLNRFIEGILSGHDQGHTVIAVCACRPGEGCTTLLLCAARRLAQAQRRTVVVDADFENPQVASYLGLLPEVGWEEVLAGRLPLAEVMIESVRDHLAIVPLLGSVPPADGSAPRFDALAASLGTLREHYDLVLVDLGQFSPGTPAEAARHWIDAAVLVHDIRRTSHAEAARARQRIEAAGVVEIGEVENFV